MRLKSEKYHMGQVQYAVNLTQGLKDAGAPMEKLINNSLLRFFDFSDSEQLVPIPIQYKFFKMVV